MTLRLLAFFILSIGAVVALETASPRTPSNATLTQNALCNSSHGHCAPHPSKIDIAAAFR
jgi:hypothetical protein